MNLLKETVDFLAENEKSPADVEWVQFSEFHCSWADFVVAAASLDYDNGYGGAEVASTLKIVGKDWWLERGEYDGSEWWEFKTLPSKPLTPRIPVEKDLTDRW